MALFGLEAINKHEWRGTVGYRFHSSRKGMKSINKINMVHRHPGLGISQSRIPIFLPSRSLVLSLDLCQNPLSLLAKNIASEMLLSAFPCCNYQIAPFPEHARWNVRMCKHAFRSTLS